MHPDNPAWPFCLATNTCNRYGRGVSSKNALTLAYGVELCVDFVFDFPLLDHVFDHKLNRFQSRNM